MRYSEQGSHSLAIGLEVGHDRRRLDALRQRPIGQVEHLCTDGIFRRHSTRAKGPSSGSMMGIELRRHAHMTQHLVSRHAHMAQHLVSGGTRDFREVQLRMSGPNLWHERRESTVYNRTTQAVLILDDFWCRWS